MFSLPQSQTIYLLEGEYSISIVVLSVIIACCAAYTALSMNQRMQQTSFFHRYFWLLLSSIAMGLGIWSVHFIGMSAFMLPIDMSYDVFLTIVSIFPAVLASYLAFYFANRRNKSQWPTIFAGVIMGLGISSMHYIGMAAMKMDAHFVYKPGIFLLSIFIAIVVSFVALFIFSTLQKHMKNHFVKLITSIVMGVAITSMHYTGMHAVIFYVTEPLHNLMEMHAMDTSFLIITVTIGISILFILSGLTSLLDRYVDHRLRYFDPLTLLPNQRQFERDLSNSKKGTSLAILHIHGLEKWINSHGYLFGDQIIKSIGDLIQKLNPTPTTGIYRIEGNRFAVFAVEEHHYENMKIAMERILSVLTKPLKIQDQTIVVETVCAISHCNTVDEARDLFSDCMAVLHHSSIRYRHEVIEYNPAIHTYSFERQIIQDIDTAMENQELFLVYQPKVCTDTLRVSGVEALLRWNHPSHGLISPGIFIPVLEESGKIYDVTDWIIEEVCIQISRWSKEGIPFGHVSINIPGPYVTSPRLLNVISHNLFMHKINSTLLELEITETSVIHDIENAIIAVHKFRDIGLSVALDDFGTGLSSLSYLKRIPITTIKIDKSFVDGVPLSDKDAAVLTAIIKLCDSLNLKVIVEGVETIEQTSFISSMLEKPHIQGYHFSRPLAPKELSVWIQETLSVTNV